MIGFIRNLFGKKDSPQPQDQRGLNEDWRVGDWAECIVNGGWELPPTGVTKLPEMGRRYRVVGVREGPTFDEKYLITGLVLDGLGDSSWRCVCFRKVRPSLEACDESFAADLRERLNKSVEAPA